MLIKQRGTYHGENQTGRQPIMWVFLSFLKQILKQTNTLLLKHAELTTKNIQVHKKTSKYKLLR